MRCKIDRHSIGNVDMGNGGKKMSDEYHDPRIYIEVVRKIGDRIYKTRKEIPWIEWHTTMIPETVAKSAIDQAIAEMINVNHQEP